MIGARLVFQVQAGIIGAIVAGPRGAVRAGRCRHRAGAWHTWWVALRPLPYSLVHHFHGFKNTPGVVPARGNSKSNDMSVSLTHSHSSKKIFRIETHQNFTQATGGKLYNCHSFRSNKQNPSNLNLKDSPLFGDSFNKRNYQLTVPVWYW